MGKANILEQISPGDALAILKILANDDKSIQNKIEQLAKKYLSAINVEDISDDVYSELDCLNVDDLWDSSGETSYGYIEPHERASEMIEESIEPYLDELKKYRNIPMPNEEKIYCMGILKGLYKYKKEASGEFYDWATDMPMEVFASVLDDWRRTQKDKKLRLEMENYVNENFK